MHLPDAVISLLEKEHVNYALIAEDENGDMVCKKPGFRREASCIARSVLLKGSKREEQIIIPSDSLLDLSALSSLLGSELHALESDKVSILVHSRHLETLPALPGLIQLHTLIDEKLKRLPVVYVQSGVPHYLLQLDQVEFRRMARAMDYVSATIPVQSIGMGPNDAGQDLEQIKAALNSHTSLKIRERLDETLQIPPMPANAQRILELRGKEDPELSELVQVIESDPALAARIVSYASSPFYGARGGIKSVKDAVVRVLGFDRVMNIALSLAVGQTLKVPNDQPRHELPYWEQAVFCAALMDRLAREIAGAARPEPGLAYLAGLLHNFGSLILAHVFPNDFSMTCRYIEASPHVSHAYIERHLISVTREQLAGTLLRSWKMPSAVCIAARNQENPEYDGAQYQYPNLVYLATRLISRWKTGDPTAYGIPTGLYQRLGLDEHVAEQIAYDVLAGADHLRAVALELAA